MFVLLKKKQAVRLLLVPLAAIIFLASLICLGGQKQAVLSWHIADKTFIIDAGHGGVFPGKVSESGVEEKNINLAIADALAALFAESGSVTVMTRTSDADLVPEDKSQAKLIVRQRADLEARTKIAQAADADYYLSIHCNSSPSSTWRGAQVFYAPNDPAAQSLAQAIQAALTDQLGNTTRQALPRQDTYLFEHLPIPAVIIECGFLSNPTEAQLLQAPAYQQKIAYAVYYGVNAYLQSLLP